MNFIEKEILKRMQKEIPGPYFDLLKEVGTKEFVNAMSNLVKMKLIGKEKGVTARGKKVILN